MTVIEQHSSFRLGEMGHHITNKMQILLDRDQLAHLPNVHLTPGMPVEALVQLGERSFFHDITQPIRDSFHRAFSAQ